MQPTRSQTLARAPYSDSTALTHVPPSRAAINVHRNERLVSALAGGFIVAWGLAHRSRSAKAVALLGSGLVYRGVSGHCHLYGALGVNTAEGREHDGESTSTHLLPTRKHDVLRSVTIQNSATEVFRIFSEPETFAQIMGHFASISAGAGGESEWTLRDKVGHAHSWSTRTVESEPAKRIRWATPDDASLVKNLTLELRAAPGNRGTEATLHLRMTRPAGALGSLLAKVLGPAPAWVLQRALGNAKCLLEAGELPSVANNPSAR